MKKYFTEIIAISLLLVVFPLANNFCFQGILDSVNIAQASKSNNDIDMDHCGERHSANSAIKSDSMPVTSHSNSLLPCCSDGNHPEVIVSSQSIQIEKFVPAIISSDVEILKIVSKNTLYTPPIISPPKLLAVSTTILRL